jgi:hypothetical protein
MNHRITHALVGIVVTVLVIAAVAFGLVVTNLSRAGAGPQSARPAVPPVTHPIEESMADCKSCHQPGPDGTPLSHRTYGKASCLTCHRVATGGEPAVGGPP